MSYMEMFGKSVLPTGEDLLQVFGAPLSECVDELSQGLFHPHDLLHNVWQQNFHEYSEYAPTSLLNFPLADHHLGEFERGPYNPRIFKSHCLGWQMVLRCEGLCRC